MEPPAPFLFGKVPERGDFVRAGTLDPLVDELDGWLQRGLLALRQPAPPDAPSVGFVLVRPERALAGAFVMSRDRSGRVFPLVVGVGTAARQPLPALVAALAPFVPEAAACAADVAGGRLAPDEAPTRLAAARPDPANDAPAASATPGALAALGGVLGPSTPALRYGLGLGLPAEPAARPGAAAHWLDAAGRLLGAPPPAPTLLWTAGGERARLVLFVGPPAPGALAYLLTGADVEAVYDVDGAAAPASAPAAPLGALPDRR